MPGPSMPRRRGVYGVAFRVFGARRHPEAARFLGSLTEAERWRILSGGRAFPVLPVLTAATAAPERTAGAEQSFGVPEGHFLPTTGRR
jgi:hypothetical protein